MNPYFLCPECLCESFLKYCTTVLLNVFQCPGCDTVFNSTDFDECTFDPNNLSKRQELILARISVNPSSNLEDLPTTVDLIGDPHAL